MKKCQIVLGIFTSSGFLVGRFLFEISGAFLFEFFDFLFNQFIH
mgnify:CR=1 FL=1